MATACVAELLQQPRAELAIAAAVQIWISSANTSPIAGKRIDRTRGFNDMPRVSGLREINPRCETEVTIDRSQAWQMANGARS
jgi:hypothetical protein